jgi:hypothetical protein
VLLHPGWFINADVRKVDFTDVKWYGMPGGPEGTIEAEVKALEERGVDSPHTTMMPVCSNSAMYSSNTGTLSPEGSLSTWTSSALSRR